MLPRRQKSNSLLINLFPFLSWENVRNAAVMLLAVQSSIPGAVSAAIPTGNFAPRTDGLKLNLTDKDCLRTQEECKFEVTHTGLIPGGGHNFLAEIHCNGVNSHIPNTTFPDQMRAQKFLGNDMCDGILSDTTIDTAQGTATTTKVDMRKDKMTDFKVSTQTTLFKPQQPPKCPPEKDCVLTIDSNYGYDCRRG